MKSLFLFIITLFLRNVATKTKQLYDTSMLFISYHCQICDKMVGIGTQTPQKNSGFAGNLKFSGNSTGLFFQMVVVLILQQSVMDE